MPEPVESGVTAIGTLWVKTRCPSCGNPLGGQTFDLPARFLCPCMEIVIVELYARAENGYLPKEARLLSSPPEKDAITETP